MSSVSKSAGAVPVHKSKAKAAETRRGLLYSLPDWLMIVVLFFVPIVLLVVCVALCEGAQAGAIIGALSGLLWGIYSFRLFGFDALVLMLIGLTAGLLVEWLLRANLLTALLLCTGASLAQALLEWLFCYVLFFKEQVLVVLCRVYLPNCLYTAVLTPLMYWLVLGLARLIRRRSRAGV